MKPICENILLYMDGDLTEQERRDFEKHLESCESCNALLNTLGYSYSKLNRLEAKLDEKTVDFMWSSISSRLEKEETFSWKYFLYAASILIILFNLVLGYFYFEINQKEETNSLEKYISQNEEIPYQTSMDDFLFTYVMNGENNE